MHRAPFSWSLETTGSVCGLPRRTVAELIVARGHHPPLILPLDRVLDRHGRSLRGLAQLHADLPDRKTNRPYGVHGLADLHLAECLDPLYENKPEGLKVALLGRLQGLRLLLVRFRPGLSLDSLKPLLPAFPGGKLGDRTLRDLVPACHPLVAALRSKRKVEIEGVVGNFPFRHNSSSSGVEGSWNGLGVMPGRGLGVRLRATQMVAGEKDPGKEKCSPSPRRRGNGLEPAGTNPRRHGPRWGTRHLVHQQDSVLPRWFPGWVWGKAPVESRYDRNPRSL